MAACDQIAAIAVIGVIGSGKSTFINLASGSNLPVGNRLGRCTTELKSSTLSLDGQPVMLIDTPGFDDTTPSVLEVLKSISDHFAGLQGVKLAGVIYMHCIAEDRIRSASSHSFRIFSKFCGDGSIRDVLVVTSGGAAKESDYDDARKREATHRDGFLGPEIDKGAYHDGSQASAHAILRRLLNRSPRGDSPGQKTDPGRASKGTAAVRELTGEIERRAKALGELCQGIDAATLTEDENAKRMLQKEAKASLDEIERIRRDLEQIVTNFAAENSRLADENHQYMSDFTAQKAETELQIRMLGEEHRAREFAEAGKACAEAQLVEGRAMWERQRMERASLKEHAGPKYDKLFACGALILILLCASRYALNGSTSLL